MKYLITGGAGFIGSHLTERLLTLGHAVVILDDLSTGSIRNIEHLRRHPRLQVMIDTMLNASLLGELVDDADRIVHLAAAVGVKLIVESPVRTIETNVGCTELLLKCAAKKQKLVFIASTSEVYGKSEAVPFREDGDIILGASHRGRWAYACSKALDEFLALAYWREKRLPVIVARFFNTIGSRQTGQYGMVVPTFVSQAVAGDPITVYGSGEQRRCFCDVRDVVGALVKLMDHKPAVGQVYNIGSDKEISILQLAERVRELAGSSSPIEFVPYDEAYAEGFEDMPRRIPSLEKVHAAIGYQPSITLDSTLRTVIDSQRVSEAVRVGEGPNEPSG